jgi:predicted amidohydrolase YtcJ
MLMKLNPMKLLVNGRIYLFDDPFTCVDSLAIANGHIVAAGSFEQLQSLSIDPSATIDLCGRTVLPGLIDAHVHLKSMARKLSMVDCETDTLAECLERIKQRVNEIPSNNWILGRGWNQNPWGRFGTAKELDDISHQHPMYLIAKSGHAAWVNSLALSLAGIEDKTPSVEGGEIQKDIQGYPTGILFENAMKLVSVHVPEMTSSELISGILSVQDQLWRMGLAGLHDFDGPSVLFALHRLEEEKQLGMRILKNIPLEQLENAIALGLRTGYGSPWLRIGNIKIFSDGALGPQTAAMIDPYESNMENKGILLVTTEDLTETILHAVKHHLAVSVHAIGDQANRIVLNAFENIRKMEEKVHLRKFRHRIEHLQLLHQDDLYRPASLSIIASMQPIHATSDMVMADQHWGDRSRFSYSWRSQLDSGAVLAFGSDAPIESPNPFFGLHAAVTRRMLDGSPGIAGWIPEEKISLQEAFLAYTKGPAFAAGLEDRQGCLLPGYWADLIVLEEDPFILPPDKLHSLLPQATMVGGDWKFRSF